MQPASKNNVTMLNQNHNPVFKDIQSFIRSSLKRSKNTSREHEGDIRLFFSILRNKEIENLEVNDLKIKLADVLDYQTFLAEEYKTEKGKSFKNITINRKISSVRSLYNFLKANDYDVNPTIFQQVRDLPDDGQRIGYLTPNEALLFADLALSEVHDGQQKRLLILMGLRTGMRKEALLNLTYDSIRQSDDDENKYLISSPDLFDKGKPVYKVILKSLYEQLIEIRGDKSDMEKVFTLSNSAIDRLMTNLCKKANLDPRRKISFHSIKKASAEMAHNLSGGDMFAVTAQGGWSSPDTAYKYYMKPKENIVGMADLDVPDDICDDMTREELLELVKLRKNGVWLNTKMDAAKIKAKRKS